MGIGKSYLINGVLACGVLYYVVDLSSSGRGAIDWIVIAAVSGVISWNLFHLGLRLHEAGGGRDVWHLIRTLTFWIVGLLNTVWVRPEDAGSWRIWVGWFFIAGALADSAWIYWKERAAVSSDRAVGDPQASSPAQHRARS